MYDKQSLQLYGEQFVADDLVARHYKIIERNVYKGKHEFDILAYKTRLFLVEVRTTTHHSPLEIVFPARKILSIMYGSELYYPKYILLFAHVLVCNNRSTLRYFRQDDLL